MTKPIEGGAGGRFIIDVADRNDLPKNLYDFSRRKEYVRVAGAFGEVEQLGPGKVLLLPDQVIELDDAAQLEALIPCMRQSAQGTIDALRRAGFRIVKEAR